MATSCWYGPRPASLAGALRVQGVRGRDDGAADDLLNHLRKAHRVAIVNPVESRSAGLRARHAIPVAVEDVDDLAEVEGDQTVLEIVGERVPAARQRVAVRVVAVGQQTVVEIRGICRRCERS